MEIQAHCASLTHTPWVCWRDFIGIRGCPHGSGILVRVWLHRTTGDLFFPVKIFLNKGTSQTSRTERLVGTSAEFERSALLPGKERFQQCCVVLSRLVVSDSLRPLCREHPRVPLRGEGSCGDGEAPRDSAGSGATEEGLTSRGGRNLRLPLRFGLRPQGPCRVGKGESGLLLCGGTELRMPL